MIADHVKDTPMGRLMKLMHLGGAPFEVEAVCRTSDGFYMAQAAGDVGYNLFLGSPKPISRALPSTQELARSVWASFSDAEKAAIKRLCANPPDGSPIPLGDFITEDRR